MITIAEHQKISAERLDGLDTELLKRCINYDTSRFVADKINLFRYEFDPNPALPRDGFYSYFRIGGEWIDREQTRSIIVVPKVNNIDFIEMFITCLHDNETSDNFAAIYDIDFDAKPIKSKALSSILSPLLIVQFLMVVRQLASRGLRKGYIRKSEALSKVKGRVNVRKTEHLALIGHRERTHCTYEEYSIDTPENRFIKRALNVSRDMISMMQEHQSYARLTAMCNHCLSAFANVSDDNSSKPIASKANNLYKEYAAANRLAQMIIKRQDIAIHSNAMLDYDIVPVFRIDMALLFEHYTLALLRKNYGHSSVIYQAAGYHGRFFPDFIISDSETKAIVDAKYVDSDLGTVAKPEYIKQLSAYCRDCDILQCLGYDVSDDDQIPVVPCVIAHPTTSGKTLSCSGLYAYPVHHTLKFYTLPINIPTISHSLALEGKRDENGTICATIEQEATLSPFNLQ